MLLEDWPELDHRQRLKIIKSRIWFGTQYYRPPHPPQEYWEKDFSLLKKAGLQVIRIWVYWRWVERKENNYFFQDMDRLFHLAEKYQLFVHPLLFLESAPEWFIRKFPETWLVDCHRVKHYPLNRKSTQIGGMAVCGNHPLTREYSGRFLKVLVKRYRSRKNLFAWDVWNELQTKSVDFVCACPYCEKDYQNSLKREYKTIKRLNQAWNSCYGSWKDAVPPHGQSDYAAWFAWRSWQAKSLSLQAIWRARIIQQVAPEQVCMVHMPTNLAIPGHGCGDWDTAAYQMDFCGNSTHIQSSHRWNKYPVMLSGRNTLCAEHDLSVQQSPSFAWACEVSSDTSSYKKPPALHPEDLSYWTWKPLSLGMKGVLYWQFEPETYGPEAPDLGLVEQSGVITERYRIVSSIIKTVNRYQKTFSAAHPPEAEIGLLLCHRQHLASCVVHGKLPDGESLYQRSVLGFYHICRINNWPVKWVRPEEISNNLKLLLVPRSVAGEPELKEKLLQFLAGGGWAVLESGLMRYEHQSFRTLPEAPGLGLAKIMGFSEGRSVHLSWYFSEEEKVKPEEKTKEEKDDAWLDGSILQKRMLSGKQPVITVSYQGSIYQIKSCFELCPLRVKKAEIIGRFTDGTPALVTKTVGKGKIFYFGSLPSLTACPFPGDYGLFLRKLVEQLEIKLPLDLPQREGLTFRILETSHRKKIIFFFNHKLHPVEISLKNYQATLLFGPGAKLISGKLSCLPLTTAVVMLKT